MLTNGTPPHSSLFQASNEDVGEERCLLLLKNKHYPRCEQEEAGEQSADKRDFQEKEMESKLEGNNTSSLSSASNVLLSRLTFPDGGRNFGASPPQPPAGTTHRLHRPFEVSHHQQQRNSHGKEAEDELVASAIIRRGKESNRKERLTASCTFNILKNGENI